jgi:hypothetical protein
MNWSNFFTGNFHDFLVIVSTTKSITPSIHKPIM